jgi:hypothetical protein
MCLLLRQINLSTVVVVFADKSMTQKLMDAAGRIGIIGRFVWILCDAWSATSSHRGVDIILKEPKSGNSKAAHWNNNEQINFILCQAF